MTPKLPDTKKRCLFISDRQLTLALMSSLLQEYSLINAGYPETIEMDSPTYKQWENILYVGQGTLSSFHGIPVVENK